MNNGTEADPEFWQKGVGGGGLEMTSRSFNCYILP